MQPLDQQSEVTVLEQNRRLVVRVGADITIWNSTAIRTAIVSAWEERGDPEGVILDLGDVRHIDSSGVGALLELANRAKKAGIPFSLCRLQETPRRLLERTGLSGLFQVYETVGEAMLGLPPQNAGAEPGTRIEPGTRVETVPETIRFRPLPSRRDLLGNDEQGPTRSNRLLWAVTGLTLAGLIVAGALAYQEMGKYQGKLNLLPAMQDQLTAAGRRIGSAEDALRSWAGERDAWAKRMGQVEAKVNSTLRAARAQAEQIAARTQQHMQAELDKRTENLQAKVDRIQAAQQSTDTRLGSVQEQLHQIEAVNSQEMERLREELRQSRNAENATLAGLDRQIARVGERSDRSQSDLASLHRKVDRERIGFEVAVNHDRELAPGVSMNVSHTDVLHQRFDGWVWLMPDRRTIWIHGRGLQQPLTFYNQGDDRERELVITHVTKYSVVGYVLEPRG